MSAPISPEANPQGSQQRMVGLRGIAISRDLIKPREQQINDCLEPPSGFLLAWLETDSRAEDEAQPNEKFSGATGATADGTQDL